ncbi:hypothetical protein SAMN04515669_4446 [Jiangella sp. DSM 45060]|nr:hypothetical protein SAMN04515669_4446 [Jiangella sp. DSM 45060]
MSNGDDGDEMTDHPVWEIGQAVYLADLHQPWTIDRLYVDQVRYVRLTRPTSYGRRSRGGTATTSCDATMKSSGGGWTATSKLTSDPPSRPPSRARHHPARAGTSDKHAPHDARPHRSRRPQHQPPPARRVGRRARRAPGRSVRLTIIGTTATWHEACRAATQGLSRPRGQRGVAGSAMLSPIPDTATCSPHRATQAATSSTSPASIVRRRVARSSTRLAQIRYQVRARGINLRRARTTSGCSVRRESTRRPGATNINQQPPSAIALVRAAIATAALVRGLPGSPCQGGGIPSRSPPVAASSPVRANGQLVVPCPPNPAASMDAASPASVGYSEAGSLAHAGSSMRTSWPTSRRSPRPDHDVHRR